VLSVKRQMPVAELKRDFREVLDEAERGRETVVLRHGRPVARIAPYEQQLPRPEKPGGLLALVGMFADWEEMDQDIAEIIADRQRETDRPVPEF
jgi:prevent-host-death family protein